MAIIYALLVIGALLAGAIYLSRFLIKKAMRDVVSVFRRRGALNPKTALTGQELGLVKGRLMDRMFRARDYNPTPFASSPRQRRESHRGGRALSLGAELRRLGGGKKVRRIQ